MNNTKTTIMASNDRLLTILLIAFVFLFTPFEASDNEDTVGSEAPGLLAGHHRVVVCYVSSSAPRRPGRGAFSARDVDVRLCTHLVVSSALLDAETGALQLGTLGDQLADWTVPKKRSPHLKVTLSVGGRNGSSSAFSAVAADPEKRRAFVNSSLGYIEQFEFDGLDLDWRYPTSQPADKANFITLVKELRGALSPRGLIVTAALGAGRSTIEAAYDVAALGSLLDLMHVMCYDYHGAWDSRTGPNAPLATADSHHTFSVRDTIKYLKALGAAASKLVLGVPMYGRTFLLAEEVPLSTDQDQVQPFGAPALSRGFQGPFTREDGFMGYNEICLELGAANSTWLKTWDDTSKTPSAQDGQRWVSYEDESSVLEKAHYAIQEGLAGVMVWTVDLDDFRGDCGSLSTARRPFPLLSTLSVAMTQALDNKEVGSTPGNRGAPDLSIPIGMGVAVLLSLVLVVGVRCANRRIPINTTCPLFV